MTTITSAAARYARADEGKLSPSSAYDDRSRPEAVAEAARTAEATLSLQQVTLSFGGVAALTDVDLAFADRAITAVIGPNGAGKTSLINVISGVYTPDSGRILINGTAYARAPTNKLAKLGIARTFQNLGLFKGLTTLDNIKTGLSFASRATLIEQILGVGRAPNEVAQAQRRAEWALELLHLQAYRDRLVGALPYGVQKRVELARAIVVKPRLLMLDEPLAGMTIDDKAEMSELIRALRKRLDATIVLIEHDIGLVMSLSDRVAVFDYGRKIAEGSPAEVQTNQAVIDAYLGVAHDGEEA